MTNRQRAERWDSWLGYMCVATVIALFLGGDLWVYCLSLTALWLVISTMAKIWLVMKEKE